jgi:hypothetical protein
MRQIVRLLCTRDLSVLEFHEQHPHLGGKGLLSNELRRITERAANARQGSLAPSVFVVVHRKSAYNASPLGRARTPAAAKSV